MGGVNDTSCALAAHALIRARWEARDILARRPREEAIDQLNAHASECELSISAYDQLLSVALNQASQEIQNEKAVLQTPPPLFVAFDDKHDSQRRAVRRAVFGRAENHWQSAFENAISFTGSLGNAKPDHYSKLEARHMLSAGLIEMQRWLWDHPHIPANLDVRLAMFLSLPGLEMRRNELVVTPNGFPLANRRPSTRGVTQWIKRQFSNQLHRGTKYPL